MRNGRRKYRIEHRQWRHSFAWEISVSNGLGYRVVGLFDSYTAIPRHLAEALGEELGRLMIGVDWAMTLKGSESVK